MKIKVKIRDVRPITSKEDIGKRVICIRDHYDGGDKEEANNQFIRKGTKDIIKDIEVENSGHFGSYIVLVHNRMHIRPMNAWMILDK
jgi:hypothetical protein